MFCLFLAQVCIRSTGTPGLPNQADFHNQILIFLHDASLLLPPFFLSIFCSVSLRLSLNHPMYLYACVYTMSVSQYLFYSVSFCLSPSFSVSLSKSLSFIFLSGLLGHTVAVERYLHLTTRTAEENNAL